jgi:hypothetical protein
MGQATGLIDLDIGVLARNAFRQKLSQSVLDRLQAYYSKPSEKAWDDVHGIILESGGWTTVWQAWIAIDPSAPRTGRVTDAKGKIIKKWIAWPSSEKFMAALRYATH